MGGRLCSQCGGALIPGQPTCQWCGTPVAPPPPRARPAGTGDSGFYLEDDTDLDQDRRASFVAGGFLLFMTTVFLTFSFVNGSGCSGEGTCLADATVLAVLGLFFLGLAISCFAGWFNFRWKKNDF